MIYMPVSVLLQLMASSRVFTVRRRRPDLVAPSSATPHELKPLSDIDDQQGLRFHAPGIHFYRRHPTASTPDPAAVVRGALAKALVFYYPLAGRLAELPNRKLLIDCTGEGALFVEADADASLDDFGPAPHPPFPCLESLVYGADGTSAGDFLDSPLLIVQVTRLTCGGFILGHLVNHAVADGPGIAQMLAAVAEIARGAEQPLVPPVWAREMLSARDPPRVTHAHRAYDELPLDGLAASSGEMVLRAFFFGVKEMAALRNLLPEHLRETSTRFEVLTAFLWRTRAAALWEDPEVEERVRFVVSAQGRCGCGLKLPAGYYGNRFAFAVARAAAGELLQRPLGYAVEQVREAKAACGEEGYMESLADFLVLNGRPRFTTARTFMVSDASRVGLDEVDFGWGKPVYGGAAVGGGRVAPRLPSFYTRFRNGEGEEGVLVPVVLPYWAMERFVVGVERMVKDLPAAAPAPAAMEEHKGC